MPFPLRNMTKYPLRCSSVAEPKSIPFIIGPGPTSHSHTLPITTPHPTNQSAQKTSRYKPRQAKQASKKIAHTNLVAEIPGAPVSLFGTNQNSKFMTGPNQNSKINLCTMM
jgi:hypothetical protein